MANIKSLTVNELIAQLQGFVEDGHGDTNVVFTYNYGDHWRTEVAATVGSLDFSYVSYSEYHRMLKVNEDERLDQTLVIAMTNSSY